MAEYKIDILVQGFPGKTVCHGSLGWSTVALLRGEGRVVLVDTGSFNVRSVLQQKLKEHGLAAADVTDVLLTHAHWDHMVNWTMFPQARIAIGGHELDWSLQAPWGATPIPELYVEKLAGWDTLARLDTGAEVLPGIRCQVAPGHTPGHLVYVLQGPEHDVVFTGDAAKNRAELLSLKAYHTLDADQTEASIRDIWQLWRARPGNVLVPGHDMPMVLDDGVPGGIRYLAERNARLDAWFGETLEQVHSFVLAP